jgi:hypothetical protein
MLILCRIDRREHEKEILKKMQSAWASSVVPDLCWDEIAKNKRLQAEAAAAAQTLQPETPLQETNPAQWRVVE